MTQDKSKGSLTVIETTKIDPIWSKVKEARYFTYLTLDQDTIIFQYIQILDQRQP